MRNNKGYKDYFRLSDLFKKALDAYVLENDCVNDIYYMAKVFLGGINQKAYRDKEYCTLCIKWLSKADTILLKDLLEITKFNDSNLIHYNAFDLMDSVSLKINQ